MREFFSALNASRKVHPLHFEVSKHQENTDSENMVTQTPKKHHYQIHWSLARKLRSKTSPLLT